MIKDIKTFLDQKYDQYAGSIFIENDPIQIPHQYSKPQDIEIAAFLTAIIAWGQRKTIIKNASKLMQWMDNAPHDFMHNSSDADLDIFKTFVHRTFNGDDCHYFVSRLRSIYQQYDSLEEFFVRMCGNNLLMQLHLALFKKQFFSDDHLPRTEKHLANPMKNAAGKRLNMFLRWMVRQDKHSIDFGIWKQISPALLMCPLDVHSGNIARKLGLLHRKQDDWKAVEELTANLRKLDPEDPVKYDIPLFALGAMEGW